VPRDNDEPDKAMAPFLRRIAEDDSLKADIGQKRPILYSGVNPSTGVSNRFHALLHIANDEAAALGKPTTEAAELTKQAFRTHLKTVYLDPSRLPDSRWIMIDQTTLGRNLNADLATAGLSERQSDGIWAAASVKFVEAAHETGLAFDAGASKDRILEKFEVPAALNNQNIPNVISAARDDKRQVLTGAAAEQHREKVGAQRGQDRFGQVSDSRRTASKRRPFTSNSNERNVMAEGNSNEPKLVAQMRAALNQASKTELPGKSMITNMKDANGPSPSNALNNSSGGATGPARGITPPGQSR
jgi:hypothetical protein